MINTLGLHTFFGANLFHNLGISFKPFSPTAKIEAANPAKPFSSDSVRARLEPQPARIANLFAPDTILWLRSLAIEIVSAGSANDAAIYIIPQLGITNRPLPGHKKAGFNLFKTMAKVIVPANTKNFDRCAIEFGLRLPVNQKTFNEELERQFSALNARHKTKARLIFYSHTACNFAASSDFETLRLSTLHSLPAINVDWLDPENKQETIWNPCTNLASKNNQLSTQLIKFIDELVTRVCPSRCNLFASRPNYFFDTIYLPYRHQNQLPAMNKIISAPRLSSVPSVEDVLRNWTGNNYKIPAENLSVLDRKPSKPVSRLRNAGWRPVMSRKDIFG